MTLHSLTFEGTPIWIGARDLLMMMYPVNGDATKEMLTSMALAVDEQEDGSCEFFLYKMTKEELEEKFHHKFDCEHKWILTRLVQKIDDGKFVPVVPPDSDRRLKITLIMLPKGSLPQEVPIQWLGNDKEIN